MGYKPNVISTIVDSICQVAPRRRGYKPNVISTIVDNAKIGTPGIPTISQM